MDRGRNDQDQLPGRLQWCRSSETSNAGPVNCIRRFGGLIYDVPSVFFFVFPASLPPPERLPDGPPCRLVVRTLRRLPTDCADPTLVGPFRDPDVRIPGG